MKLLPTARMHVSKTYVAILLIAMIGGVGSYYYSTPTGSTPPIVEGSVHLFQMQQSDVNAYGFYYPLTFRLSISSGASNLKAYYSHDGSAWKALLEKQPSDFFNGENVVRFDYASGYAYVSAPFEGQTKLYVKVTTSQGATVETNYLNVAKYYDNRQCTVTSHHDDYGMYTSYHLLLMDEFQARKLWYGCAVVTGSDGWAQLQAQVNEGYIEVESHASSHVQIPSQSDTAAWNNILTSHTTLLNSISNMPYGQYVLVMIWPYSNAGERERNYAAKAGFLVDEVDATGSGHILDEVPGPVAPSYASLYTTTYNGESYNIFPTFFSADMGTNFPKGTDITWLNGQFDNAYAAHAIYEVRTHPQVVDISAAYCQQHLNYIAGRLDVWYAPLGLIYTYHYASMFLSHTVTSA